MKKIIIISYFYPPANFAGSYRAASWAKYLHKFNYYPIIITRCWNQGQIDASTPVESNILKHEKNEGHEVIYVPHKKTLRDFIYHKFGESKFVIIRKMLSLFELIMENFSNLFIPYNGIYDKAVSLLQHDKDIKLILISGKPFQTFRFGFLLHQKFGIKWAPDYRDGWQIWNWNSTNPSILIDLLQKLEKRSENKWCSSASFFTATTDHIVGENENILPIKGYKVMNGYDPDDYNYSLTDAPKKNQKLSLLYNGTLYKTQDVDAFIAVYKEFLNQLIINGEVNPEVELTFLGLASDPIQKKRVEDLTSDIRSFVNIMPRISKKEVIEAQLSADVLLFFAHKEVAKENYPSKIFEYFACHKPIMLYPSDQSVIADIISETNTGIHFETKEIAIKFLLDSYGLFKKGKSIEYNPRLEAIQNYTRENQTKVLSHILDRYLA